MFDPVQYQRSLCPKDVLVELDRPGRPTPPRFLAVLTGASEWTPEEREVIDHDPKLQKYERAMREALFGPIEPVEYTPAVSVPDTTSRTPGFPGVFEVLSETRKGHHVQVEVSVDLPSVAAGVSHQVLRFSRAAIPVLSAASAREVRMNSALLKGPSGLELLIYSAGRNEATLEFIGSLPPGTPRFSAGGQLIEQARPFDPNGFATVNSDTIDRVLARPDVALDVEFV